MRFFSFCFPPMSSFLSLLLCSLSHYPFSFLAFGALLLFPISWCSTFFFCSCFSLTLFTCFLLFAISLRSRSSQVLIALFLIFVPAFLLPSLPASLLQRTLKTIFFLPLPVSCASPSCLDPFIEHTRLSTSHYCLPTFLVPTLCFYRSSRDFLPVFCLAFLAASSLR